MSNLEQNQGLETLLNYIKRVRGFDFTGYKRSSLMRRVRKRMQTIAIEDFNDYLDHLQVHPQEFSELFNTILINVTSFFRDRPAWDYISSEIIPRIVERKEKQESIRVWTAGCASGQEAYTLTMILAETLGIEAFRERVKIYATDLDDEALNLARYATYNAKDIASVPPKLLDQYFEQTNGNYTFRKDLRRCVIFGRHNLVQDAPISRIDLLVCRNTLMYFNAEAQAKIIARFHFALNENGFLFLGKAEMLLSHSNSFTPVDLKLRIFSQMPRLNLRTRLLMMNNESEDEEGNYLSRHVRLRDASFDANPVAQVVVDINSLLILANERARNLFGLASRDLNRPLQDLELSYRPVELRSCLDQVYNECRVVILRQIEWLVPSGESQYFDVQLTPLFDLNGSLMGAAITFTDVSGAKRLQQELEHSNQELEMAYEELQSTNEELETTNEELQSSNEELETTNEELQSTNEELETMNEELQSSNEELQTLNEELHRRTTELNSVNTFLSSILGSMRGGVVVIDRDLRILIWNDKAEDLWGLRADEVQGKYFLNLDIGLPVDPILQPIRNCLASLSYEPEEVILNAINRRGKAIKCRVTFTPLVDNRQTIQGAILLMEEQKSDS
ncbi:chemotaxis protein CheR [Aphanothece hegewaldii CCALA 016]|uniref:protein-glutamate O-methyltransferase n=1 Tax=Aphanothece hegewaldii CCALA 016 TaxID=2107694 RepID=A0A2T1LZK3_9CHRO|nr:CheR family methyltransferase [Aphanothece hegewaldii]PSF37848.1 chemotaxis protein CheR [Aphanothece hegewaldii CCALA 016]